MNTKKLTLQDCFKYPFARIIIADTTTFANVRCMGIPNSPQALDALEKYGQLQLRPLSSLTEKECNEICDITGIHISFVWNFFINSGIIYKGDKQNIILLLDECRKRNFDIDGLQERGIAVYE